MTLTWCQMFLLPDALPASLQFCEHMAAEDVVLDLWFPTPMMYMNLKVFHTLDFAKVLMLLRSFVTKQSVHKFQRRAYTYLIYVAQR